MADSTVAAVQETSIDRREPENRLKRSIFDVPVKVSVSLGSIRMKVREILELETDTVFPLDARIEDPIELIVDGRVVALGELKETDDGGIAVVIVEIPHGDVPVES
jgi:flagellar motor switch protein FliN